MSQRRRCAGQRMGSGWGPCVSRTSGASRARLECSIGPRRGQRSCRLARRADQGTIAYLMCSLGDMCSCPRRVPAGPAGIRSAACFSPRAALARNSGTHSTRQADAPAQGRESRACENAQRSVHAQRATDKERGISVRRCQWRPCGAQHGANLKSEQDLRPGRADVRWVAQRLARRLARRGPTAARQSSHVSARQSCLRPTPR
ncbi:LAMI_0A07052g1_1 [Lachancea mirantina]|uniref:LAMI_0A07052g1_1 n=1 Tax=Lachancea mirantina TaxID=1230905 RepID=A0A1G4IQQ6_9SACH|nr:LAMI_0A07052g1_1 [Lachancea mirantina]